MLNAECILYIMISTSLVLAELETKWLLTKYQKSLIGGSIFLGFIFGSLMSGLFASKGRLFAFQIGIFLSSIGAYLSIYSSIPIHLIISNFIIGIGLGVSISNGFSIIPEISNSYLRSYIGTCIWILFPFGEIIACLVAQNYKIYITTTDNWRKLFLFRFFLIMIIIPFTFLVDESPKFLISVEKYTKAFDNLKLLMRGDHEKLTEEKKETIIRQYKEFKDKFFESKNEINVMDPYKELFVKGKWKTSIVIFINWFNVSYLYYGLIYVLPLIFERFELEKLNQHKTQLTNLLNEKSFENVINSVILGCMTEIPILIFQEYFLILNPLLV